MNICIISPTAGLERYSTLSKTHLVLAHIRDDKYISFYDHRRVEGDTLILDNGAHEFGSSVDWRQLEAALCIYKPEICILPDTINDPTKSARDSLRFLDKNTERFPDMEWMYVVQEQKPQVRADHRCGWYTTTVRVLDDTRVGSLISWLGISRYLAIDHRLSRTEIAQTFFDQGYCKNFHALGMSQASIVELNEVRDSGLFTSLDTSSPVWRGWCGKSINETWDEYSLKFDEQLPSSICDKIILDNLSMCGVDVSSKKV